MATRTHLQNHGVVPEQCKFRLVAVGPIERESRARGRKEHDARRDKVAALEQALEQAMCAARFEVMNTVKCRKPLDDALFNRVNRTFRRAFPNLT